MTDIINLLNNDSELIKINLDNQYNEGYLKSLKEDKASE